jgi:hypothetical protein
MHCQSLEEEWIWTARLRKDASSYLLACVSLVTLVSSLYLAGFVST